MNERTRDAAGCLVYRCTAVGLLLLVIADAYGEWTIPKGHLDPGETAAEAAERETEEETGIRGELGDEIGTIEYMIDHRNGPRRKRVTFFLLETAQEDVFLQADEGIEASEWLPPDAAIVRIGYAQVRTIVARAVAMIGAAG